MLFLYCLYIKFIICILYLLFVYIVFIICYYNDLLCFIYCYYDFFYFGCIDFIFISSEFISEEFI